MNTSNRNLNISAYRVLYLLKALCNYDELTVQKLNELLVRDSLIKRALKHETVIKHLKTLELVGFKVARYDHSRRAYKLRKHAFQLELSKEELQLLCFMLLTLENQPLQNELSEFYRFFWHIAGDDCFEQCNADEVEADEENLAYWELWREKVEHFARYCQEGLMLELQVSTAIDDEEKTVFLEPQGLIYQRKRVYLTGIDYKTQKRVRYFLGHIRSYRQLPSQVRSASVQTTVVFELTGRVAKSYRPYPGEHLQERGDALKVTQKTDDVDQLLKRLVKYGSSCRILSPGWIQHEMCSLLKKRHDELLQDVSPAIDALLSTAQTNETLRKWVCHLDTRQTSDASGDG